MPRSAAAGRTSRSTPRCSREYSIWFATSGARPGQARCQVAVALAWVRDRPSVVAPIVGARTSAQLQASLAAESVELPPEIRRALDDVSAEVLGYPERMPRWSSEDLET